MRNRSAIALFTVAVGIATAAAATTTMIGCGKSRPSSPGAATAGHVAGTPHTNRIIHGLKNAGLRPEGFTTTDPARYGASFCEYGRVNDIDALVCEFADGGSLARGQQLLGDEWGREGLQTGVTAQKQQTLLALADRGHHDPNGKTINQIVSAFKKL